jgi:hypothetical protein
METKRGNQPVSESVTGPVATAAACAGNPFHGSRFSLSRPRGPPHAPHVQQQLKDGAADAPTSTAPEQTPDP